MIFGMVPLVLSKGEGSYKADAIDYDSPINTYE